MKFTNAYELILFLYENDLIEGLSLGLRGEFEFETTIKDKKTLKILNEIWESWRWGETAAGSNATYGGFYSFYLDSNNNLVSHVDIQDDLLDFHGNPFDIEYILSIISDYLSLESIDKEEDLESQICLDLELEFENVEKSIYELPVFTIKSNTKGDSISVELSKKLKEHDINKIKELVIEYLLEVHNGSHSYEGFSLKVEDNCFSDYSGTGSEVNYELKTFLENETLDIDIDFTKIIDA